MTKFRMGDLGWHLTEDDMEKLYPALEPQQRAEAAENLSRYFKVTGKIYDHLDDEGKLKDTLLRIQYEKRNRNINESCWRRCLRETHRCRRWSRSPCSVYKLR